MTTPANDRLSDDAVIRINDLKIYYPTDEGVVRAVDGVDFEIKKGETLGVVGESGCGKSTVGRAVLNIIDKPGRVEEGDILWRLPDGREIDIASLDSNSRLMRAIRGAGIALIFQEPMTSFSPLHTVGNQIIETIRIHQQVSRDAARDLALEMLRRVGMPNPARNIDQYTFNLSGGMRQRAMVALSLACRPKLLIADEPTTAVDVTIQAQMLALLREIQADLGMAIIMITHDMGVIAELADRVLIMYLGKEVEQGPVEDVFHGPRHPYTRGLLASIPKMEPGRVAIQPIAGSVPSPYALPAGCKFHPRCAERIAGVCERQDPPMTEVAAGHEVSCYLYVPEERA